MAISHFLADLSSTFYPQTLYQCRFHGFLRDDYLISGVGIINCAKSGVVQFQFGLEPITSHLVQGTLKLLFNSIFSSIYFIALSLVAAF